MFSSRNATSPAPANSSRPNTTMARRPRQKATRDLNTGVAALVARRGFQHIAEKHAALGHDQLARLQTIKHRVVSLAFRTELQMPLAEMASIGGDPGDHRAIAPAHGGRGRDCDCTLGLGELDADGGEHPGPQFIVRIFDAGTYVEAVRVRVDRRVDFFDLSDVPVVG